MLVFLTNFNHITEHYSVIPQYSNWCQCASHERPNVMCWKCTSSGNKVRTVLLQWVFGLILGWGIVKGIKLCLRGSSVSFRGYPRLAENYLVFIHVLWQVNKQRRELSKVRNHIASWTNGYKFVHGSTESGNWKKVVHFKSCSDLDTLVTWGNRNSESGGTYVLQNLASSD